MLLSAIILGLMGSLHCVGMCGPIAFMLPVDRSNNLNKFTQIFVYHFGRVFSYGIIGLVFGFLGKGLFVFGMQQKLSVLIGVIMILLVLVPYKTFNRYNLSKPIYRIISKIKGKLGKELQKKTADTFLTIGFLNGFLPCGLVYMALFGAIAMGNPWQGSLYMILFGLGTIPLMTTAVYAGNFLNEKVRQHFRRAIPIFIIIIGVLFIIRGMGFGIPYLSPKPVVEVVSTQVECD